MSSITSWYGMNDPCPLECIHCDMRAEAVFTACIFTMCVYCSWYKYCLQLVTVGTRSFPMAQLYCCSTLDKILKLYFSNTAADTNWFSEALPAPHILHHYHHSLRVFLVCSFWCLLNLFFVLTTVALQINMIMKNMLCSISSNTITLRNTCVHMK